MQITPQSINKKLTKLLSWSETYLKTDMFYLTRNGFWLLFGQGSVFLLSFVLVWGFANLLPPEIYGEYRFLITVISILSLTALPGINITLVRAVAQGKSGVLRSLIKTRVRWSFLGLIGGLIGSAYYFYQGDIHLAILFLLIGLTLPFAEPFSIHTPYLNGHKDFKNQAKLNIIQRGTITVFVFIALLFTDNIFILLGTFLFSTILIYHILSYFAQRLHPPNDNTDEEIITYTKHISLQSAIRLGAGYLDKIILWYVAGPIQVAMYTIAIAIPQELQSACSQIGTLALPKMAARKRAELRDSLMFKFIILSIAVIPLIVLYIICSPLLFQFFFPQYESAILYSQIAAFMIFGAPLVLITQYFYAIKATHFLYVIQITEPLSFIILMVILTPPYGVIGTLFAYLGKIGISMFLHILLFFLEGKRVALNN